jgi:hypothetical protein
MRVIDSHTAGEPTRVIVDAGPDLGSGSLAERRIRFASEGDLLALIIEEGEPDRVALYANDSGAATCTEMLESVPGDLLTNADNFNDVATGSDIQTG